MEWVRAEVHGAGLFHGMYAQAVLGKKDMKVVGCILSCEDSKLWKKKLKRFDEIEGFKEGRPKDENLYQRDIVKAKP